MKQAANLKISRRNVHNYRVAYAQDFVSIRASVLTIYDIHT